MTSGITAGCHPASVRHDQDPERARARFSDKDRNGNERHGHSANQERAPEVGSRLSPQQSGMRRLSRVIASSASSSLLSPSIVTAHTF